MNPSGIVVRTWNDAPISRRDSDGFADATAMCQANGKRWHDYERLDRTADYMKALAASTGLAADELIVSTKGGPAHLQGTWIHPRLAVDLARWLSPDFAVWMDGWFLEQAQAPQAAAGLTHQDVVRIVADTIQSVQPVQAGRQLSLPTLEPADSTQQAIVTVLTEAHANGLGYMRTKTLIQQVALRFGRAEGSITNALTKLQRDQVVVRRRIGQIALKEPEAAAVALTPFRPAAPGTFTGRLALMDLVYRLAVAAGRAVTWADIRQHLTPEQSRAVGLRDAVDAMQALEGMEAGIVTTDNGIAFKAGKDIARLPWLMA